MKRTFKKTASLLFVLVMCLSLSITAFAADSSITFKGAQEGFEFQPGSVYTATDLFDGFKNVMPGDRLRETIQIKNEANDCDYIKIYLKAAVHDESDNLLSEKVGERETLASMEDFLAQLTMRIFIGENLIYEASPNEAGALVDNVLLGNLFYGDSMNLNVEVDVPLTLGNEYANRLGEVDWVFLAECVEYEKMTVHKVWEDNGYPNRPEEVTVHLLRDGEKHREVVLNRDNQWTYTWDDLDDRYQWSVEEVVPNGYEVSYRIEDNNVFIINKMNYYPSVVGPVGPFNPIGPIEPEEPIEPTVPVEPIELCAKKVWADEDNKLENRPDFVVVTLYNGDTAVEKVTLGVWNNWTYTWDDLDGEGNWSVIETGIPNGYTPDYQWDGDTVVITNTATLIQAGQMKWPIPVLGSIGVLLIFFGIFMKREKKKNENW